MYLAPSGYVLRDGFTYFPQTVGVMAALPNKVPDVLPFNNTASSKEWFFGDGTLPYLSAGNTVNLLVTTSGDLHIFINGRSGQRLATGLPVNQHLWGVASVQGICCKIKSEMLSGKVECVNA